MYHVCLVLCAAAHIDPVSKLLSLIADPAAPPVQQLTVGLMPIDTPWDPETDDPYELITHWLGAYSNIPEPKLSLFQNLNTSIPTPPGGWPWVVNGVQQMTEAEAQAAVGYMTFFTGFQETEDPNLGLTVLASIKNARGLKGLDV